MSEVNWWQSIMNGLFSGVGGGGAVYLSYKFLTWSERLHLRRLRRTLNKTALQLATALADVQKARTEYLESEEVKRGDAL